MVKIKVPATTANLGPGFDTLGLALNLFQEILVEKAEDGLKQVIWPDEIHIENAENFVLQAAEYALASKDKQTLGYTITMLRSEIPVSRGLGSSAAAIVAGLYAANYLLDYSLTQQELLDLATQLEGHPDNVAPAILGNLVISTTENGKTHFAHIDFPDDLLLKVFIPDFKLSTAMAREILPEAYSREQCIYNISRVSLLIHAFVSKDYSNLSTALSDAIHEPFRKNLIGDSAIIFSQLKNTTAYGCVISGAGPSLIAIISRTDQSFDKEVKLNTEPFKHHWECVTLSVNKSGALYEILK